MDGTMIERFWVTALDTAAAAIDAASRAHTLTAAECGEERARIAAERAWLGAERLDALISPLFGG